jgi:hypothetical protein
MSMNKPYGRSFLTAVIGCILTLISTTSLAKKETVELDVSFIFLELNSTDQDLGIHSSLDAEAWRKMRIRGPNNRTFANITARSGLGRQGITQLDFESAEPEIPEEIDVATTLGRAPEGLYRFKGQTINKNRLIGEWELSHVMAAPAEADISVGGVPWVCDGNNPNTDVLIEWDAVTEAFDDEEVDPDGLLGGGEELTGDDVAILYTLVIERDEDEDLPKLVFRFDLPPGENDSFAFTVPAQVFSYSGVYKWEIIVRTGTHNQTSAEGCITEAED